MKKGAKLAVGVLAAAVAAPGLTFGGYWHRSMHWYDTYDKCLKEVGAVEKQFTLPSGRVINYGEVKNGNPPLLLIHGQMSIWQDYALVMPEHLYQTLEELIWEAEAAD